MWPVLDVLWRKHWHVLGRWKELPPLHKFLTKRQLKKKKKFIYNYCRNLFSHSLVPWTRSGACSVVRLDFFCARKALRHHCIAYVWYDEMWNQRTGQCRYRAMCVFLCASKRWHLIVMNFKAGSRGSDSIGQFMKTVGGIRALYVCADRTESHSGIRRPWGWRAVCLVYAVSVGYVFMYVWSKQWLWNSTPSRPGQHSPSYCAHSVRKKQPWF